MKFGKEKIFAVIMVLIIAVVFIAGCGGGGGGTADNQIPNPTQTEDPNAPKLVTDNITETVAWGDVPADAEIFVRLDREGGIWQYPVDLLNTDDSNRENLYVCHTRDNTLVVPGDSGSQVLMKDKDGKMKLIGALCYGTGEDFNLFWARNIADVLNVPNISVFSNNEESLRKPAKPLMIMQADDIEEAKRLFGDAFEGHYMKSPTVNSFQVVDQEIKPIIGSQSIVVLQIKGDLVNMGAVGSISHVQGDTMFAFGHGFDELGTNISIPVYRGDFLAVAGDQPGVYCYKEVKISNHFIGCMTVDERDGIMIKTNAVPKVTMLTTHIKSTNKEETYNHKVALTGSEFGYFPLIHNYCLSHFLGANGFNNAPKIVKIKVTMKPLALPEQVIETTITAVDPYTVELVINSIVPPLPGLQVEYFNLDLEIADMPLVP